MGDIKIMIQRTTITITRDSVAAGDDTDAPHMLIVEIEPTDTIKSALESILRLNYLPKISGGNATWSVASSQPIAVFAQQWSTPHHINPEEETCQNRGIDKLHFNYHGQESPEIVLRVLSRFRTVS